MSDTRAARRGAQALNALHSIQYFTPELPARLERFGVTAWSEAYFASRAAPLGPVAAPVVTAVFGTFAPDFVAAQLAGLWQRVTPEQAIRERLVAAGDALHRLLGPEVIAEPLVADAAKIAGVAAGACALPGRALSAANSALAVPEEPHIALWHHATRLREYRGDGHVAVLDGHGLAGVDALVLDCASRHGMPAEIVRPNRGWTEQEWEAGRARLAARGLVDGDRLTGRGVALRDEVERETHERDRLPYDALGDADLERLATVARTAVRTAAAAFPPPLDEFFVPDDEKWNTLDEREDRL